jgi:hypothetical protein
MHSLSPDGHLRRRLRSKRDHGHGRCRLLFRAQAEGSAHLRDCGSRRGRRFVSGARVRSRSDVRAWGGRGLALCLDEIKIDCKYVGRKLRPLKARLKDHRKKGGRIEEVKHVQFSSHDIAFFPTLNIDSSSMQVDIVLQLADFQFKTLVASTYLLSADRRQLNQIFNIRQNY